MALNYPELRGERKYMKGITPVVATILLLMITISITGVSFVFMQRATQTASQSSEQQLGQQTGQIGSVFSIEGADKNIVYIKNMGARSLNASSLNFYVSNVLVESSSAIIAPGTTGAVALNDSKLAMLPDPAELKVTSAGFTDKIKADFYGKYTVGYWKFDEGSGRSGNYLTDNSGNNKGILSGFDNADFKDGTIYGATVDEGRYGKALNFDGINDYVNAGTTLKLGDSGNSDFSVGFWIKATGNGQNIVLMSKGNGDHIERGWRINTDNSGNSYLRISDGTNQAQTVSVSYQDGLWHYLTFTVDRDSAAGMKAYVDGDYKGTANPTSVGNINRDNLPLLFMSNQGIGGFYKGTLDEVRIYDRALTSLEINESMTSEYPLNGVIASYSFIDGSAKDNHNWVKGSDNNALQFDGIDDNVYINDAADGSLDMGTNDFTISFWIKPKTVSSGNAEGIISKGNEFGTSLNHYTIQYHSNSDSVFFEFGDMNNRGNIQLSPIDTSKFYNIVLVVDRDSFIKGYIDGNLKSSVNINLIANQDNSDGLKIASLVHARFNGTIDEVRILNIARSMTTS